MKKIIFISKGKSIILVRDTETDIMYGNVSKKDMISILRIEDELNKAIELAHNPHYQVAKQIKVRCKITTEVVIQIVRSNVINTAENALRVASKFNLEAEVQRELDNGAIPLEALREWNII